MSDKLQVTCPRCGLAVPYADNRRGHSYAKVDPDKYRELCKAAPNAPFTCPELRAVIYEMAKRLGRA